MNKLCLLIVSLCLSFLFFNPACTKGPEKGACTISCGGSGTGQPFVWTNHPFKTQQECLEMGEEKGPGCKASYCPPTGNSDDCFQVYP